MADKAFLSGINDYKSIGDLRGCVNDVRAMKSLLVDRFGFDGGDVRTRTNSEVTKEALREGWNWLVTDAEPGDRLVFHFSGHGSYTTDADADEADQVDELLCLYAMDWDDSESYLTDDELRRWTQEIPRGVAMTIVLDCCHSGTGTRKISPPKNKARSIGGERAVSLVDVRASSNRLKRTGGGDRSIDSRDAASLIETLIPASAEDIGRTQVLARFAPPPPKIEEQVRRARKRRGFRGLLRRQSGGGTRSGSTMNHTLWAGCRDDQTSADAYIDGDYRGAFTHHFCQALKTSSEGLRSKQLIGEVRAALEKDGFDQVPQLEPEGNDLPPFGAAEGGDSPAVSAGGGQHSGGSSGELHALIEVLKQIVDRLPAGGMRSGGAGSRASSRGLVSVHGICVHPKGFSDRWWDAFSPHLASELRQMLDSNRHEVLWSRHVSTVERAMEARETPEERELEQRLRDVLQDRTAREATAEVARSAARGGSDPAGGLVREVETIAAVPRAVLGIPGLDCVDDFVKYLSRDSVRTAVLKEFSDVVGPMLQRGDSVELISHSWGTIVAFEGLRMLESEGLPGRVHTWFTVGSALSIPLVADRLRPRDGRRPAMVDRWVNLDARGDVVGGSLQVLGMGVNAEYLDLRPVGCRRFGRFTTPACAHSSYFNVGNLAVNRDIFAREISR